MSDKKKLLPLAIVDDVGRMFPEIWKKIEEHRSRTMFHTPWPDWCVLPFLISSRALGDYGLFAETGGSLFTTQALVTTMMWTWRLTQGIYRFHPEIREAVLHTPLTSDLPTELFFRLPEWACYFDMEGTAVQFEGKSLRGFWVRLEYDLLNGQNEVQFVFISGNEVRTIYLELIPNLPITECLYETARRDTMRASQNGARLKTRTELKEIQDTYGPLLETLVSLVLFVCAKVDVKASSGKDDQPANPKPVKTKKGIRFFPAPRSNFWDCGFRLGAALESARNLSAKNGDQEEGHSSPRAHVRMAHWHSFWVGKRKDEGGNKIKGERLEVKWIHPLLINAVGPENLIPTVHKVK